MKLVANIILFTLFAFGYVYLANLEHNYRLLFMLPFQFVFGVILFFIKRTWKSGLGMILGVVIYYGVFISQVLNDQQDPLALGEAIGQAFQSFF